MSWLATNDYLQIELAARDRVDDLTASADALTRRDRRLVHEEARDLVHAVAELVGGPAYTALERRPAAPHVFAQRLFLWLAANSGRHTADTRRRGRRSCEGVCAA